MSGNPFRRQTEQPQPAHAIPSVDFETATVGSDSVPVTDSERRSSKVKRVRIATPPPLSPDSPYDDDPIIRRVSNESHEGSPPPSPQFATDAFINSEGAVADDLLDLSGDEDEAETSEEVIDNTRRNSETNIPSRNATGGVVNPFQRTLATMEGQRIQGSEQGNNREGSGSVIPGSEAVTSNPNKGFMDVDSFKRMLLTGNTDSAMPNSNTTVSSTNTGSSGYFTRGGFGTSSRSQQSLSETSSEDEAVSPKTPLKERQETDDVSRNNDSSQKPKPPPPKPRHGKLVDQQRTPQTVSFSDFTPTETIQAESRSYPKALPQVPPARKSPPVPDINKNQQLQRPDMESSRDLAESQESSTPQRNPPPPPLTRRSGQAQSHRQSIVRENPSSSTLPPGTQQPSSLSSTMPEAAPDLKPSKGPPPPPIRRSGAKQVTLPDQPRGESPQSTGVDEPSNATSSRSSSIASRNRVSMPPPPPPRRRGSSKSSLDQPLKAAILSPSPGDSRRTSQESPMQTNDINLERVAESEDYREQSGAGTIDGGVLADMARLQAEVDVLRAKYGKGS